jgi:hypothetical protein
MRNRPLAALLLASFCLPASGRAAPPVPELLARLGEVERRAQEVDDSTDHVESQIGEQLDGEGKVTGTQVALFRVLHEEGKQSRSVLLAEEDGKESPELRRRLEGAAGSSDHEVRVRGPFHPDVQGRYVYQQLPAEGGLLRISFTPREPARDLLVGEALVDPDRAVAIKLSGRLSKLPRFADQAELELRNELSPEGLPRPAELRLRYAGGLLFFKKRGRSTERYFYGAEAEREITRVLIAEPRFGAAPAKER